jgi:predicted glutamine amidotransferase
MCGLVGIAGKLEFKDEHFIKHLLYLDMWRGKDSTGLASYRNDGTAKLAKIASHPIDLFDTIRFKDTLNGNQSRAFIGHNRAATKGQVNAVNAHPFIFGNIIGAHNGTLTQASHNALQNELGEKYDVDSQAIFACIAAKGLKKTVSLLQGAWALTFVDTEAGTLNILKNKERPLWYAYNEDRNKVIWASEFEFINYASKSGASPTKLFTDADGYKFFPVEDNQLYTFDLEALRAGTTEAPYKPKMKEMKGKEPPTVVANNTSGNPFGMQKGSGSDPATTTSTTSSTSTQTPSTTTSPSKRAPCHEQAKVDSRTMDLRGSKSDPFASLIDKSKFYEWTKDGCACCGNPIIFGATGVLIIEQVEAVIGPCCTNFTEQNRILVPDLQIYM